MASSWGSRSPAPAAFAQTRELSSSGELLDRIAAVVNEGVVLVSQLDTQTDEIIERLRQQNTELPPRNVLRRQILERLVVEEIQVQRADRIGIEVSEEMLNGALDDVAKRNNIPFPDLPQALAQQGIDYRDFRDEIRRQMTLQLLRQRDVIAPHQHLAARARAVHGAAAERARPERRVQHLAHPDLRAR